MQVVGGLHILILAALCAHSLRSLRLSRPAAAVGTFILVWSDLVLTGHILSLVSRLNAVWLYAVVSLLLAVLFLQGLKQLAPTHGAAAGGGSEMPQAVSWPPVRFEKALMWFFLVTGGLCALLTLFIAATHLVSNPDTIVYRFPRIFWYLGQGNLKHFTNASDPRVIYYPLNGVLLYFPLAIYRFGPLWFNLPTVLAWGMITVTTYAFARAFAAPRIWAAAAAWLIALTPNVLIQAVSTNDEIIAAAAMLAGLYFVFRWSRTGGLSDAVLGTAGVCLSVGTKLHVVFYWVFLIAAGITLALRWRQLVVLAGPFASRKGGAAIAACTVLAVAMVASFMIFNFSATGQITDPLLAKQVLNTPLNPAVSFQQVVIYAAQTILGPFSDIVSAPGGGGGSARGPIYTSFNAALAPLFTWVNQGPAYMSVGYRFTGVVSGVAFFFNEHTVILGFSWLVAGLAAAWLAVHRKVAPQWALWHSLSFFAWFLTWAASTKYIEGIPVYLAYAAIVSAPAWVFAFAAVGSRRWSAARWAAVAFVAATHLVTAYNIMTVNTSRSVMAALTTDSKFPLTPGFRLDASVKKELALATSGITSHSIYWGQPHWLFMAFNPSVPQFIRSGNIPFKGIDLPDAGDRDIAYSREVLMPFVKDDTLHIYPIRQLPALGSIPVRITGKPSPGLTLIGDLLFAMGPEWVFAVGNGVERRHPGRSGYIVINFSEAGVFGRDLKPIIQVSPRLYGLGREDSLEFRYAVKIDDTVIDQTEWSRSPAATLSTAGLSSTNGIMTIEVRNMTNNQSIDSVDVPLRSGKSLRLQ
jgi:hypothetical protein